MTRVRRLPRIRLRVVVALAGAVLVLFAAWLWFRDSSLVAVRQVSVTGLTGPDAAQIRQALDRAARKMTTLDVNMQELHAAVARYPAVKQLRVSTGFPHSITIAVLDETPVATASLDGRTIVVGSNGAVLRSAPSSTLPQITVPSLAVVGVTGGGSRVSNPQAVGAVALLAAAPDRLRGHLSTVSSDAAHGLIAQLRNGPAIYFGDDTALAAKWTAAVEVLADAGSVGAGYIDVSDPARPVAGE
jgi:cell division protein FtsQ